MKDTAHTGVLESRVVQAPEVAQVARNATEEEPRQLQLCVFVVGSRGCPAFLGPQGPRLRLVALGKGPQFLQGRGSSLSYKTEATVGQPPGGPSGFLRRRNLAALLDVSHSLAARWFSRFCICRRRFGSFQPIQSSSSLLRNARLVPRERWHFCVDAPIARSGSGWSVPEPGRTTTGALVYKAELHKRGAIHSRSSKQALSPP